MVRVPIRARGEAVQLVGVRHVVASTTGGIRTESWSYKVVRSVEKQKVSEHTLHRQEFVTTC